MKRFASVVLGLLATLVVAMPAQAAEIPNVDSIIAALQESPVYIANGTEGVTSDTAAILEAQLSAGDNIVLVMLPSDAVDSPEAIEALATQIGNGLGDERIVGVASGSYFDADAEILPPGVADELMHNADTVSQNPVDTLGTFISNAHDWVRLHPGQIPVSPEVAAGPDLTWLWISLAVAGVLALLAAGLRLRYRLINRETVKFDGPGKLRDEIRQLMNLRQRIRDPRMAEAVLNVSRYVEAYFSRLYPDRRWSSAATATFEGHLQSVLAVTNRYVDIVNNKEYYDEPAALEAQAVESVESYAEFVLTNIKTSNRRSLTEFSVDTKILAAQRYH